MKKISTNKYALTLEAQKPALAPSLDASRRPLSKHEIASLLGKTPAWIARYAKAGKIPSHQIGKSYKFYYLNEVLAALEAPAQTTSTTSN